MKTLRTAVGLGVLTALLAMSGLAGAMHGSKKCTDLGFTPEEEIYCPTEVKRGSSCHSYGVLITERAGVAPIGDVTQDFSESLAWTVAIPGQRPFFPPPQQQPPIPPPPSDPQAHADAEQVGLTYNNGAIVGGLGLDTSTIFSRCDVVAVVDPFGALWTQAYGRAGVEDFELSLPGFGVAIGAEVLDFEINAFGAPFLTWAFTACDVVQVGATPIPGLTLSVCPPPNTGATVLGVTVEINEQWGPLLNSAGQWVYGGAALHVTVATVLTTVDVYVGYVTVAVTGGPALPPFWIADPLIGPGPVPCFPAPCQP